MSKQEIGWCLLNSKVPSFEEQDADLPHPASEILNQLDTVACFKLLDIPIYAPKNYQDMSRQERIEACFQHCVLKYLSNDKMTNASLRKRLGISEKNYALASRIIKEAIDQNKIKVGNPKIKNAKYIHYTPFYA